MIRSRPTVLLTGSTGVIGTHLLPALATDHEVTALVRHRRPPQGTTCVQGDLNAEDLALSSRHRRELAARTDVIVHCAALTDFAPPDMAAFDAVNAEGTRRILELADDARAPVILLSSAAAAFEVTGDDLAARSLRAYSHSKRRAEELAAHCNQPVAIVRTALLFAARNAPAAPRRQFPHTLFDALLRGRPGGLPLPREHWCDITPMETLIAYLTALTETHVRGDAASVGIHWATAGPARLTAADVEDACTRFLDEAGHHSPYPLLSPPSPARPRTHGMARLAQLGFQSPEQPCLPSHLDRLLPTQLTRKETLDALAHNIRLCAATALPSQHPRQGKPSITNE
ncbi:SDR family oxidoreductase [Streptomyces sp. NPDC055796]